MLNDVSQMHQMNVSCDNFYVNPIKAGGSKSKYRLRGGGGVLRPPPLEKGLMRIGIGMKCMFIAQFFKASSLKTKIRSITFIVWVLGRVEKNAKKNM